MSRYRLAPTTAQGVALRDHCAHARYVWNLAVEQHSWWRPGRDGAPAYLDQCRQLTGARAEYQWLRAGSQMVQQQLCCVTSTRRCGTLIRLEDLRIANMTRSARGTAGNPGLNVRAKAGLNREIMRSGWGLLARRLGEKAPGRVEKVNPAYTSQRCSACGHIAAESRKSQALFACVACSFACNADVNAARNIAAGHAVTARGGDGVTRPVNREPQLLLRLA
jgi:hypothetical protein